MKKVMSINLGGFAFKIDEDAYQMLEQYIQSIKSKFANETERKEIVGDIEFRISEIFTQKLKTGFREVVDVNDVQEVIKRLGKPETIAGEDEDNVSNKQQNTHFEGGNQPVEKRLFRNPDDKVISGVCSGLSAYLGINDPIWIRVLLAILLFSSFGTFALIYIIAMLIIPEATTTSQKLQMQGKPVTLQNIEDSFSSVRDSINHSTVSNNISNVIYVLVKIVKYFLAGLLILIGFSSLTAFTIAMVTGNLVHWAGGFSHVTQYLFDDTSGISVLLIAVYVMVAIPCITLILMGIRVLINRNFVSTPVRILILGIWLVSIISFGYMLHKGANMFAVKASVEEVVPLKINTDKALILRSTGKNDIDINQDEITINGQQLKDGKLIWPNTELIIVKSPTGRAFLERIAKAHGKTKTEAEQNASNIVSKVEVSDSSLFIDEWFEVKGDKPKFRNQRVKFYLNLPVGAKIYLHNSAEGILNDIKNVHDMLDEKMYGHVWEMTEYGLTCTDCSESEKVKYSIYYQEENEGNDSQGDESEQGKRIEKRIIKKISNGNIHIKDEEDEIIIDEGKIIVKEGDKKEVIEIKKDKKK